MTTEKMLIKILELYHFINSYYAELDDLAKRLQDDYGVGERFEQKEEDRLAICGLLDIFDEVKGNE